MFPCVPELATQPSAAAHGSIPDYELLHPIGRGAYGEVWLARNLTGSRVALKIVRRAAFDHDRPFQREFEGIQRFEPISRTDASQIAILHLGRWEGLNWLYHFPTTRSPPGIESIVPIRKAEASCSRMTTRSVRSLVSAKSNLVDSFTSKRGGSNSWAQSDELIAAFRSGNPFAVPPLSVEYAPILACNAACPFCPYAGTRHRILNGDIVPLGELSPEDDVHASRKETAFRVIDASLKAGAKGFLFTGGGEPTIWPSLVDALNYCGKAGLHTAIYTNGFEIARKPDFATRLLHPDAALVFCRLSINTALPKASRLHWGVDFPVIELQLEALARLLCAREELQSVYRQRGVTVPSVQVSTIVDKHTVADLPEILQSVARVFARFPSVRAEDDTMVVRPLTIHGHQRYSTTDHPDTVITQMIAVAGPKGTAIPVASASGLRLFLGFGLEHVASGEFASYSELLTSEYTNRTTSLANGVFLTVGPDASVYPCTERNCDPAWALGNLKEQSVTDIYQSAERREVLARFDAAHWGPELSQPTSRTARLERIAHAIHNGALTDSAIEQIRQLSFASHRLLLD